MNVFDTNRKEKIIIVFLLFLSFILIPFSFSKYTESKNRKISLSIYRGNYIVYFDSNGGEGSMDTQEFRHGISQNLRKNTFTKENYYFASWNTKADGSGDRYYDEEEVEDLTDVSGGVVTLYAQWSNIGDTVWEKYDSYFDRNQDSLTNIDANGVGDTVTFTTDAVESGEIGTEGERHTSDMVVLERIADYLLGSSYTDLVGITGNVANYERDYANIFKYVFDSSGRLFYDDSWDGLYVIIEATGYSHMGNPKTKFYNNYPMFFSDGTYNKGEYAVRLKVEKEGDVISKVYLQVNSTSSNILSFEKSFDGLVKITFDNEGVYTYKTLDKNSEYGELPSPTKEGYTFDGWYLNDTKILPTDIAVSSVTLTARYIPNTYTIVYNANGGEGSMDSQVFTYDEAQNLSSNTFVYDDKTFKGWNTSADGSGTSYADEEEVINLTTSNNVSIVLYAQWKDEPQGGINKIYDHYLDEHSDELTGKDGAGNADVVTFLQQAIDSGELGTSSEREAYDIGFLTNIANYIINNMTYTELSTGRGNYAAGYQNIFIYKFDSGGGRGRLSFDDSWNGLYVLMIAGGYEHVPSTNPSNKFYNNYPMFFGDNTFAVGSQYTVKMKVVKDSNDNITSVSLILSGPSGNIYTVNV